MSIDYWPIVLYGVRCGDFDLKIKKEYCDENIGQDDIWDFLCSFSDLLSDNGLIFWYGGEGETYIGIPPTYPWENSNQNKCKTKSDADKVITDFMFKYFDIEMPKEEFIKKIDRIETCGWG